MSYYYIIILLRNSLSKWNKKVTHDVINIYVFSHTNLIKLFIKNKKMI